MKIEVQRIKAGSEFKLQENITASRWDLDSFDVKFINDILLDCTFMRISNEIIVDAKVTTHRNIICSRCLTNSIQEVKQEFRLDYNFKSLGDYLEVDKDIREEILLNFPMKVLCRQDCKGVCPGCKANLNIEECKCQMKPTLDTKNIKG